MDLSKNRQSRRLARAGDSACLAGIGRYTIGYHPVRDCGKLSFSKLPLSGQQRFFTVFRHSAMIFHWKQTVFLYRKK